MFHVRPAYTPAIASNRASRPTVSVGAVTPANTEVESKVSLRDVGLYVALPAVAAGAVAFFAGLGAMWSLGAGVLGGGAGYLYLDHSEKEQKLAAEKNAADADAARDAKVKATMDVTAVAALPDSIGAQAKAGLALFSVGFVPGDVRVDFKLAAFPAVPTDAVVKQLTDLQETLSEAGYALAASQIADAASAAAMARDLVMGGTTPTASTTTPTGEEGTAEAIGLGSASTMFGT